MIKISIFLFAQTPFPFAENSEAAHRRMKGGGGGEQPPKRLRSAAPSSSSAPPDWRATLLVPPVPKKSSIVGKGATGLQRKSKNLGEELFAMNLLHWEK